MALRGLGYSIYNFPPAVDGDLILTNATGGDLTTVLTTAKRYRNITVNATSTGKQILQFGARVDLGCTGVLTLTNNLCILDASGELGHSSSGNAAGGSGVFQGGIGGSFKNSTSGGSSSGPTSGSAVSTPGLGGAGGPGGTATIGGGVFTGGAAAAVVNTNKDSYLNDLTRSCGSLLVRTAGTHPQVDVLTSIGGGAGGNGGAIVQSSGTGVTGGGGGGGGGILLHAQIIDISGGGIIRANGGDGHPGDATGTLDVNAAFGGGGGGGGGIVWLNYGELRQGSGLIQASGGAGGAGSSIGTGVAGVGAVGSSGKVILWSEFGVTVT